MSRRKGWLGKQHLNNQYSFKPLLLQFGLCSFKCAPTTMHP
jgi:hypothetical protein